MQQLRDASASIAEDMLRIIIVQHGRQVEKKEGERDKGERKRGGRETGRKERGRDKGERKRGRD